MDTDNSAPAPMSDQANALAELDGRQKEMVVKADIEGLTALSSPDLTINAPSNRVLTRDQFLAMMKNGQIAAETFERTVESVTVNGDIGIVMGRELITPAADSELGQIYGARSINRRYTNVFVLRAGKWLWLARHANVVSE